MLNSFFSTENRAVYDITLVRDFSWYSDSLRAASSGNQIAVERRFSAPVQTGPLGPPSPLYNGYSVSFLEVKRPVCGVDHPPVFSAEVNERVEL